MLGKLAFEAQRQKRWPRADALEFALRTFVESVSEVRGSPMPDDDVKFYRMIVGAAATWADHGFPCLQPDERLAASLMLTRIPREYLADIRLPWRCFGVRCPITGTQTLFLRTPEGQHCWVFSEEPGAKKRHIGREPTLAELFYEAGELQTYSNPDGLSFDELGHELRGQEANGRLLVGLCLDLESRPSPPPRRPQPLSERTARRAGIPVETTFLVTRPVVVDHRATVRRYITTGEIAQSSVRCLVRGHWKQQPHGPKNAARRWQHVEPYWRGPEDAPIAVRPHVMRAAKGT
jgi:hypothetical protein